MGMDIEVIGMTWYTVHLSDKDVEKVKQWLEDHRDNLPSFDPKENISKAVWNLYSKGEISLFDDDKCTESDFNTEEIRWSEFEEREPEEIFGEKSIKMMKPKFQEVIFMRFAKYYNVTKLVDDMQKKEEIDTYPTEVKDKFV